jgi:uncharacterized protein (DUF2141 family)
MNFVVAISNFWIDMRKRLLILFTLFLYKNSFTQVGKVIVEVENIQTKKGGTVSAAVFDSKNFLKAGKQLSSILKEITSSKMIFVFEDLTPGEYAFVAYQDIDRNKTMKKNWVGYPIEPWGISNNPRILFGPPSFSDSKVKVNANQTATVNIKLN